jgi:hypothetical protein
MALEFEAETNLLWAVCDDNCEGRHSTLDVAQSGPNSGKYVVTNSYERPAGMANLNNEGFAITPQAECVNGFKPAIWADDGNTDMHALRQGTLNCTGPGGPGGGGEPDTDADDDGIADDTDRCRQLAGPAPSGCPAAARRLTFGYSRKTDTLKGKLSAPTAPACAAGETVQVFRKKPGPDKKIATAKTKPDGKWSKRKRRVPEGKLYAKVNSRTIDDLAACGEAKSRSLTVK